MAAEIIGAGRVPCGARARVLVLFLVSVLRASAWGAPTISIEPAVLTVDPSDLFGLRIMVDAEADTFSNFDVVVRIDPGRVEFVEALEGSLYVNSGYNTWFEFEEESTGVWEVFDVIFPAGSFLVAPGELARLRLRALADGCSAIEFLSVALKDIDRLPIEPVETENGLVRIGSFSAVPDAETAQGRGGLGAPYPNPTRGPVRIAWFSPTEVFFPPPFVGVYDLRGRIVGEAEIVSPGRPSWFFWNGRDLSGVEVPAGVYFFRARCGLSSAARRIVILR
ncbi:MAG: hypothetical protein ABIH26_12370 [Candidatus Eisenbacteria bacterium]